MLHGVAVSYYDENRDSDEDLEVFNTQLEVIWEPARGKQILIKIENLDYIQEHLNKKIRPKKIKFYILKEDIWIEISSKKDLRHVFDFIWGFDRYGTVVLNKKVDIGKIISSSSPKEFYNFISQNIYFFFKELYYWDDFFCFCVPINSEKTLDKIKKTIYQKAQKYGWEIEED